MNVALAFSQACGRVLAVYNYSIMSQTGNYVLLFAGWITLYLAMRTVPSTVSYLQTNVGFSLEDIGNVLSCFGLTYSLTKLASGFLYDNLHLSPKPLFCWGLGMAGLICVCFPLAASTSLSLTCLLWTMEGVFQGFGWPACARMLKRWYKPSDIGGKYLLLSAAANAASAIAPMFSVYLAGVIGWQYSYYILGTCCLIVTSVLVMNMEYCPKKLQSTNFIDLTKTSDSIKYAWHNVFLYKEFLLVTAIDIAIWGAKICVVDWIQLFITQQMKHSTVAGMLHVLKWNVP